MHIGMTYDLIDDYLAMGFSREQAAEFDKLETIEAIEQALIHHGHTVDRIGSIHHLIPRLLNPPSWDLVFNIAEGMHGLGREAQVPALLDAFQIPYTFSDTLTLALTLHKGMSKAVVRDAGIPTADFAVIHDVEDILPSTMPCPLFLKPVAEGTGKGIHTQSKVTHPSQLADRCRDLLDQFKQPVLVERFLPGREFTVGLLGTGSRARALGVMEIHLNDQADADVYSYANKEHYLERVRYSLVEDEEAQLAASVALNAWRVLECRDAGRIDVRSDDHGRPHFLEVNPLAGLNPTHSDLPILCRMLGMDFTALIGLILEETFQRLSMHSAVECVS